MSVFFITNADAIILGSERPNFHGNEMNHKRNEDERQSPFQKDRGVVNRRVLGGESREVGCAARAGRRVRGWAIGHVQQLLEPISREPSAILVACC